MGDKQATIRERREFTERVLLSLAGDIVALNEATSRVTTQIRALAKEYQVDLPEAE